ncbi:STM4015 family protein [Streptomyces sp. NBC_00053]|uniref:STM4015 family protein n=1 Tax=unclassified Streptomyces TaxID=2593676 RepID=UPI00224DB049|nr:MULTISPECIES: STM4015 family protein [unclassified Streptomyces]WSX05452.1 STM4015 family protein [Streptomyces sp. NBC_00987]MCX5104436.1 STM4015 family protein [Streptomyces sp. NBC_00439]MCX5164514.1 STM4015 family protein [Streptomyces sp. NBC_00305]MCX5223038.1 STM4015 family protein [Streptomyces sp. NBC_00264]MCX5504636.1 STM4015 family protein [Streptomyces sp. NBC_00052]
MSGVDHLHELFGLPAVDFQHASGEAPVQAADAAAWRISVDPYDDESEMTWEEAFKAFLDTVDPAGVRALIVGQWGEAYEVKSSYAIDLIIAAADRLTSLEAVFIGDMTSEENEISWIEQSDVTALLNAFPGLLELGVRGGTDLVFSPSKHERLRSLTIETGGLPVDVIRGILDSELPALERLDLWLGVSAYGGDADVADLAPLLSGTRFPRLTHLGLRNSEVQNEIAAAVASAPVVAQLRVLDLSNGTMGDEGAAALLDGQPLTHLEKLDLYHHFMTEPMERRIVQALEPHGVRVDVSERETPWGNRGIDGRYTSVSE